MKCMNQCDYPSDDGSPCRCAQDAMRTQASEEKVVCRPSTHRVLLWDVSLRDIASIFCGKEATPITYKSGAVVTIYKSVQYGDGYRCWEQDKFDSACEDLVRVWKEFESSV